MKTVNAKICFNFLTFWKSPFLAISSTMTWAILVSFFLHLIKAKFLLFFFTEGKNAETWRWFIYFVCLVVTWFWIIAFNLNHEKWRLSKYTVPCYILYTYPMHHALISAKGLFPLSPSLSSFVDVKNFLISWMCQVLLDRELVTLSLLGKFAHLSWKKLLIFFLFIFIINFNDHICISSTCWSILYLITI